MKINEIFYSIEGEGKRVGQPCVFIRRSGCNLHCRYDGKDCDTPYRNEGTEMTVDEIMQKVRGFGCYLVTLTGGEPLLPSEEMEDLRDALYEDNFEVNIETNGTMSTEDRRMNEFFTVDYKCGCSGESSKMKPYAFARLTGIDVVKFVVSESDFPQVEKVLTDMVDAYEWDMRDGPMVYISPCYGRCNLNNLAQFVKKLSQEIYERVAVNLQIHKIIWAPDMRGV